MLSLFGKPSQLCDGVNRREWLRVGGLGLLGLSLADVLRARLEKLACHFPVNDNYFAW